MHQVHGLTCDKTRALQVLYSQADAECGELPDRL